MPHDGDFDFEPVPGLPGPLPDGEKLLWTGQPSWRPLALKVFRIRWVAAYVVLIAAFAILAGVHHGHSAGRTAVDVLGILITGTVGIAIFLLIGWLMAINTVYTVTSRRIVIRHGLTMPTAINIPFAQIDGAAFRPGTGGTGDITVSLTQDARIALFALWPHARIMLSKSVPDPALRAVPNAEAVAQTLANALRTHLAENAEAAPGAAPQAAAKRAAATARPRATKHVPGLVATS